MNTEKWLLTLVICVAIVGSISIIENSSPLTLEEKIYSTHYTLQKEIREKVKESSIPDIDYNKTFLENYDIYTNLFYHKYNDTDGDKILSVNELIDNDYVGDCEDYAIFMYIVAEQYNLNPRYVIGHTNEYETGHAWIQIKFGNEWYDVETTGNEICKDCISNNYKYESYFFI